MEEGNTFVGDRCSLSGGVGLFKSTLCVYIPNAKKGRNNSCRNHNKFNNSADVNGGYLINDPTTTLCRLCGSNGSRRRGNENGSRVLKQQDNGTNNNSRSSLLYRPSTTLWSQLDLFDTNNNALIISNMTLANVTEGIRLCANVRRGTENVDSIVVYKDNRRYKNQIIVSPGLCPCPSAFSETNFMHISNTSTRFKNRVLLHNRQFKTKRRSETVCITPKTVHKNYKTTLTHDLNPHHPLAWHETKLDFVPRKFRSVYHINFSSTNKNEDNVPNPSQKFSFEKWQYAEINSAFSKIACLGLNDNNNSQPLKHLNGYTRDVQCRPNDVVPGSKMACDSKRQSNPSQVIITNVLNSTASEYPRHRYFTMEQI